ncbi:MAG TPA: hypothetical protein VLH10_09095 [Yinghuangia sp.]|uniref:hypothetical protein n=1 Tax=Yinghuangia sp. YIM S10712 TaxID=3436930 RepID=UPI002CA94FCB|nr:hypothetical protein [Yinghuangia sp.]
MNTTSVAALGTAVVGLSACAWAFLHGPRQNRMTACVLASIVVCLALVFWSIGRGGLVALDAALVIGALGPLITIVVAVRGRGLGRGEPQPPAYSSPQQPLPASSAATPDVARADRRRNANGRGRHAR